MGVKKKSACTHTCQYTQIHTCQYNWFHVLKNAVAVYKAQPFSPPSLSQVSLESQGESHASISLIFPYTKKCIVGGSLQTQSFAMAFFADARRIFRRYKSPVTKSSVRHPRYIDANVQLTLYPSTFEIILYTSNCTEGQDQNTCP